MFGQERSNFEGLKPVKLKDYAKEMIIKEIISKKMKPGEKLNEKKIAKMLGTSITPIREAFIELANEGIVELARYKAPCIVSFGEKSVRELLEAREALESYAAMLAAQKIKKKELADLKKIDSQREEMVKNIGVSRYNNLFHDKIIEIGDNEKITEMLGNIRLAISIFTEIKNSLPQTARQHKEIIAALEAKDPEAARKAMAKHLADARRWITGNFHGDSKKANG